MKHKIQDFIPLPPHLPHESNHPGRSFNFRREPHFSNHTQF